MFISVSKRSYKMLIFHIFNSLSNSLCQSLCFKLFCIPFFKVKSKKKKTKNKKQKTEKNVSLVAQMVKRLSAMQETWVRSLGWEGLLEKEMAAHSSILAWKIPWMVEPGSLPSKRSQRIRYNWATSLLHFTRTRIMLSAFVFLYLASCVRAFQLINVH